MGCINSNVQITYIGTATNNANFTWNWDGGTVISGSGIGLSTVKKIVALYSGNINVESDIEKGTKFTIELNKI